MSSPNQIVHGYELGKLLGSGTFGKVYEGRTPTNHRAAIKIIDKGNENAALLELKALESMKHLKHAHLLPVYNSYPDENPIVIVMELADGTLQDRLRYCKENNIKGIPIDELLHYMWQVASALDYLHEQGMIHRDIKPGNIMLFQGSPPNVKLGDCGLLRENVQENEQMTALGTPAYIAPEAWRRLSCFASDQYSFAVTYAELRQGELPLKANNPVDLILAHQLNAPNLVGLGDDRAAVERALHKDHKERFTNCRAFVEALEVALNIRAGAFRSGREVGLLKKSALGQAPLPQQSRQQPIAQPADLTSRMPELPTGIGTIKPSDEMTGIPPVREPIELSGTTPIVESVLRNARTKPPPRKKFPIHQCIAAALVALVVIASVKFFYIGTGTGENAESNLKPRIEEGENEKPIVPIDKKKDRKDTQAPLTPVTVKLNIKQLRPVWVEAGGKDNTAQLEVLKSEGAVGPFGLEFQPRAEGLVVQFARGEEKDKIRNVRVQAMPNARPGFYRVGITTAPGEGKTELPQLQPQDAKLEVHVFPAGFRFEGEPRESGQWCYPWLVWERNGEKTKFLLIKPREGRENDPGPFYIQENKVTNGQFRIFAEQRKDDVENSAWMKGGSANGQETGNANPRLPALRVTWDEAKKYADWMGTALPSPEQLDRAAGWPGTKDWKGPFKEGGKVAVARAAEGPSEVGGHSHDEDDISPDEVRGLAGNGREWTIKPRASKEGQLIELRGQSYTAPSPLLYRTLDLMHSGKEGAAIEMDPKHASPFVGFRVVLKFEQAK